MKWTNVLAKRAVSCSKQSPLKKQIETEYEDPYFAVKSLSQVISSRSPRKPHSFKAVFLFFSPLLKVKNLSAFQ